MFSKLFQKHGASPQSPTSKSNVSNGSLTSANLNPRLTIHYGIPETASILACDPIQRLVAVGTSDGRIKVIGGENVEALLVSPKQLPFKHLEFLQNQGFLVSVSNENEIQVWDLEWRKIASIIRWESNITAFKVIQNTSYMYLGDEHGMVYIVKYDAEQHKLSITPYYVPTNDIDEAAGISSPNHPSVVGVLPQPCSQGNRVLIAYENGLLVIWDVSEDRVVLVRGNKDLQLHGRTSGSSEEKKLEVSCCTEVSDEVEKEISSLCWASNDGSILAVGYVDGDIMFWNLSTAQQAEKSPNKVVKLQLSSGEKKLPVIVLHSSANQSCSDRGCKLFVYGGDKIGSEVVLTILSLEWSSGIESLKCVSRLDLILNGSFADMVLLPTVEEMEIGGNLLFVLSNPGQLHVYDDVCLAAFMSQKEKKPCVSSGQYVMPIPTVAPCMTVSKLGLVHRDGEFSKVLSKIVLASKHKAPHTPSTVSRKWPLTGGIPSLLSEAVDHQVERVYMTGYQDGSVRIWDATYPALSLIFVLGTEVPGIDIAGTNASVSALEIWSFTHSVAIGNECGMVRLYKLTGTPDGMSLNIVKETEKTVHTLHQADGPPCLAVFSLFNSPVCVIQFTKFGTRLAVGFKCGRAAMLDVSTFSVLFVTDSLSSNCPVSSFGMKSFTDTDTLVNSPKDGICTTLNDDERWLAFIMTKDGYLAVLDGRTGHVVSSQSKSLKMESSAISIYILEGGDIVSAVSSMFSETKSEPVDSSIDDVSASTEAKSDISAQMAYFGERSKSSLVLLCFEDALLLCSLKSVIQGTTDSIRAVNLSKQCCWTSLVNIDDKESGLVLLYRTGVLEIRSLTTLEVMLESSLMTILRWNFKMNMEKMMCSSNRGQIILIHGCEFAAISLLAIENDFRIPDSLPCIHDTVLAATFDGTVSLSPSQKKSQDSATGILGGIIKSLKVGKQDENVHTLEAYKNDFSHLDSIFSNPPFLKPSMTSTDGQQVINLNIDDIQIDDFVTVSSSSDKIKNDGKEKINERERLFEGANTDTKPKLRTPEEIRAKYKGAEDAAAAAARARDRLVERQEKLERINERTQELQNGAENFASMASELAKRMEKRKWWNI